MLKFESTKLPKKKFLIGLAALVVALVAIIVAVLMAGGKEKVRKDSKVLDPELARAMTYDQFEDGDENVDGTDNVKFSAFFLRDVDGDGYAEKLKGTCKEIGKEDTLYMEVNVQTDGILKNGKIEVDGKNFYLVTSVPKDNELKDNYISVNTKVMEFADLNNGTQKLLTGVIRSGNYSFSSGKANAIGSNINNLSRDDNKVVFTGTYVDADNNEIEIRKEVDLTTDWYGSTSASLYASEATHYDIESRKDEANGIVVFDVDIRAYELNRVLNISENYVEGVVPQLNGFDPVSVTCGSSVGSFEYDEASRKFSLSRVAKVDDEGDIVSSVSADNYYRITIKYPIEAYSTMDTKEVAVEIPVMTYFTGCNNPNSEFVNPYKSNEARKTLVWYFRGPQETKGDYSVRVGQIMTSPNYRYVVSKKKPLRVYNGLSDTESNDFYTVKWNVSKGSEDSTAGVVMKETENGGEQVSDLFVKTDAGKVSMEDSSSVVGVGFVNADRFLKADGWIKVYDDETGDLLVTFTKADWGRYVEGSTYQFELPVKHVRVETSETEISQNFTVVLQKEIDDDFVTANFAREQFDELQNVRSHLCVYIGDEFFGKTSFDAVYEEPFSVAGLSFSKNTLSTQVTEKNQTITIRAMANENQNQVAWMNGSFLVKVPKDIILTEINEVSIDNASVEISSYEYFENDNGKFIKVNTKNVGNSAQIFNVVINVNVTPDPRISTQTEYFELYAANEESVSYYSEAEDIFDVNDNLNVKEKVHKSSVQVSLFAPNTLLTNQTISNFDVNGTLVVSPQIADVKPALATVEEKTVRIGAQVRNNYTSTISEVKIFGKIPFKGNTYVIHGDDLKSTFTTKMTEAGLELPEALQGKVKVYYSANENPDRDVENVDNGWKLADEIEDWDSVKTYLIDFGDEIIPVGAEYTFYYTVKVPNNVGINQVSYSHHGVYLALDTAEGKYRTQTEPNKIGIRVARKYSLELQKYHKGKDVLVPGATYRVTEEADENGDAKVQTVLVGKDGKAELFNLYAEKSYTIEEIKTPDDYELNEDAVKFVAHVKEDGSLEVETVEGSPKEALFAEDLGDDNYKVVAKLEDEVMARLRLTKVETGTSTPVKGAKYRVTGDGLPAGGRVAVTNVNGVISLSGLKVGTEYTLEEVSASGYYLAEPVKFVISNNDGVYSAEVTEGAVKADDVVEEDNVPVVNFEVEDEKIPTYDLEISKIKKVTSVGEGENGGQQEETVYLAGAKFRLYKGAKLIGTYVSDEAGKIAISGLYQYIDGKDEDATYLLKEVLAPEGYAKVKDVSFKVDGSSGELKFVNVDGGDEKCLVDGNVVRLTIEDSPSFRLIKKDAETGERLAGVKFAIYDVEDGSVPAKNSKGEFLGTREVIDGNEFYTVTTDGNGELTADLPEGMYKAVEVWAPEKYDVSGSVYYFGVGASREGKTGLKATWAQAIGGDNAECINSVAETSDGGYIVGGRFEGTSLELGNGISLKNHGSYYICDGMIIKYDVNGNVEWAQGIGTSSDDYIYSVAEVTDGGYIVGGTFRGESIDLGNGVTLNSENTSTNYHHGMLIKYNSKGIAEWAKIIDCSHDVGVNSVIETSDGGYLVGGKYTLYSVHLNDEITLTNKGSSDGMVIKYNASGEVEWAQGIGGTDSDEINSVAETSDGGYIVGGYFSSEVDLGNENKLVASVLAYDAMVIKYNEKGELEWAKGIGKNQSEIIYSVCGTSDGGCIVGGFFFSASIDIGNGITLTKKASNNYSDAMIIKYDVNGQAEWARGIGGTNSELVESVCATSDGGCIVGGSFKSVSVDLENNIRITNASSSTSNSDGMIIKYDSKGQTEWAQEIGGTDSEVVYSAIEMSDGNYIVGGRFNSDSVDLGNELDLKSNGSMDGMLVKFEKIELPDVEIIHAQGICGKGYDEINSVAKTRDGGYIVGGSFSSNDIDLGNGVSLKKINSDTGFQDGMVVKYNVNGNAEWAQAIGGNGDAGINYIVETSDGGYIAGGYFGSESVFIGDEINLTNRGFDGTYDGMLIKYTSNGEVEWAKEVGGTDSDYINSIVETSDGGYIVGGYFGSSIDLENGMSLKSKGNFDGMVIKYDSEGKIEWAKEIGGTYVESVQTMASTRDGGCIVGVNFRSSSIDIGDGRTLTNRGNFNVAIIKYNSEGKAEWIQQIGGTGSDTISSVVEANDGGYVVAGDFGSSYIDLGNGINLTNKGETNVMLIKYNSYGKAEWAQGIGGTSADYIHSMIKTTDGGYLLGGRINSDIINFGDGVILSKSGGTKTMLLKYDSEGRVEWGKIIDISVSDKLNSVIEINDGSYLVGGSFNYDLDLANDVSLINKGSADGMILKVLDQTGIPEVQELEVTNSRKEFKITTDVKENDNVKGGSISGEDESSYEIVKYGDSSTKEIRMIPDENYEIVGITINGENYPYNVDSDGSFTMPAFTNMTEDKHVVVEYLLKDNKITINKVDKDTKEKLAGAKFKLEQIDERVQPDNATILGELTGNGQEYTSVNVKDEVTGKLGELTNNGTYYFVQNADGTLTPTNSMTYQIVNGGTEGISDSTANSYIPIDLTGLTGQYAVVVNASCSSEDDCDIGYATVTENVDAPSLGSSAGEFVYVSGIKDATNYTSELLDGGKIYYLHIGYYKDSSVDNNDDQLVINSIKLYNAESVTNVYNFVNNNGKYESTNQGMDDTEANSYIPIDLTNFAGTYKVIVNAEISSELDCDYGYVMVTENTDIPAGYDPNGRVVFISGNEKARDYSIILQGGQMYYLHLGYYKDAEGSVGDDKFIVNSVKVIFDDSEMYRTTVETNSEGQAITQIPFGKYTITEVKAPDGYVLNDTPMVVEFRSDEGSVHEFTMENEKFAKLVVHHYLKGSTTSVADDEVYEAKAGDSYTTKPKSGLGKYELEKDANGEFVLPDNATGVYGSGTTEVTYYYEEIEIPLTVHHYVEGTMDKVPLKDGGLAEDVVGSGKEGDEYTTSAVSDDVLSDEYELASVPANASGVYAGDEVVVTYYYKKVSRSVNLVKYQEDGVTPLEGAKFTIDGAEYVTDANGKIAVSLGAGTYEVTEVEAPEGYRLPEDPTTEVTITRETGSEDISIINEKISGTVTVHHYVEGTTTKITLADGSIAEDEVKTGAVGEMYATKARTDISRAYRLVGEPVNASGTFVDGNIDVIYYYKMVPATVIVHHYEEGTVNKLSEDVVINGLVDDAYTTVPADDVPIKYELAGTPEKATGTMTEETIEVIYYYRVKSAVVNVRYLEKGTDAVLEPDEVLNGKVDEEYSTSAKVIDGYQLVEHSGNENGKFEVNPLTITYYYLYKTKATVLYIDKMTGEPIESRTEEGLVGDEFVTESKSFPNYVLVEEPDEKTVKMTKEGVTLKYYYVHVSAGVVEKHLDIISGATLHNEVHEGNEGDPYEIKSMTFDGYDLVEDKLPTNAKGTMKVDSFDVIYYYIYRTKVNAKYLDKVTGEPVADDEVINGHEGDAYETERKVVDGYKLVEVPAKADGTMTKDEIDVTYYYVHTSGGVIVNHLDVKTGKQLKDESKIEGYEGDPYETHEENIPGYELVQDRYPDNAKGTMMIDEIPVNYYYAKLAQVKVRYVDKDTGDDVAEEVVITGKEGDEYTTEAKDVPGYDLVEEPEAKDGVLKAEDDEVVYYYRRPAKLVARYFDKDSGKEIEAEETTSGYQNDEYVTEAKEVKYYELVAKPSNAEGAMKVTVTKDENGKEIVEDTTYVDYYYRKMIFNLKIDKTIASVSVNGNESVINGDLAKVEVYRKDMATAKVQIKYLIKVINDSELSGKATIMENIPAGMTMNTEKNMDWAVNGSTATRETKELAPGESESYEVVLDWQNGDGNIGMKENVASIISSENDAGFDEKDTTDNEDKADIIVAISTGGHTYVMIAGGVLLVLIAMACGVYIVKKQD